MVSDRFTYGESAGVKIWKEGDSFMAIDIAAASATVRALANVVKEAGKIDLYQKVLDLQQVLLEAITQNTELATENHALAEKVRELQTALTARDSTKAWKFDGQVYWSGEPGVPANGPLCPRCKDKDDKQSRMADRGNGFMCCRVCDLCVKNKHLPYPALRLSPYQEPRGYA